MRPEVRNQRKRAANHTFWHFRQKRTHDRQSAGRPTGGHRKPECVLYDVVWDQDYEDDEEEDEEEDESNEEYGSDEEFWETFAEEFWNLYDEDKSEGLETILHSDEQSDESSFDEAPFYVDKDGVMHSNLCGMDYKQAVMSVKDASQDQRAFILEALQSVKKGRMSLNRQRKFHKAVVKSLQKAWEVKEYPTSPRAGKHVTKKGAARNTWSSRNNRHGSNRVDQRPLLAPVSAR